jgi:hypothetical protein
MEGEEDQASGTSTENQGAECHSRSPQDMLPALRNFNAIFLPPWTWGCHRCNRVINNKAVRNLMTFARRFRVTLNRYAADRGVIVTPVSEAYTTKTCTRCGVQNDVGAARHVSCSGCGLRMEQTLPVHATLH